MAKPKTTKGASKKSGRKRLARMLPTDPPILVGGGGSTFIWIRKDLVPQLVDPTGVPSSAPQPHTPDQYYCFTCTAHNTRNITTDDGNSASPNPGAPKGVNSRKHYVQFDT
jgi:hypothetical protein